MKLSDVLGNIPGLAALAIIVIAVSGVIISLVASAAGRPLDAGAQAIVTTFTNVLIGLAVGSGVTGSGLYMRQLRIKEADELRAKLAAEETSANEISQEGAFGRSLNVPPPPPPTRQYQQP